MNIEEFELTLSQARMSREDLSLVSGVSRPTIIKMLAGEEILVSRQQALNGIMRLIRVALEENTLPIPRRREGSEVRRQALMVALADGAKRRKARPATQPPAVVAPVEEPADEEDENADD